MSYIKQAQEDERSINRHFPFHAKKHLSILRQLTTCFLSIPFTTSFRSVQLG
jgi:hypothetical protein